MDTCSRASLVGLPPPFPQLWLHLAMQQLPACRAQVVTSITSQSGQRLHLSTPTDTCQPARQHSSQSLPPGIHVIVIAHSPLCFSHHLRERSSLEACCSETATLLRWMTPRRQLASCDWPAASAVCASAQGRGTAGRLTAAPRQLARAPAGWRSVSARGDPRWLRGCCLQPPLLTWTLSLQALPLRDGLFLGPDLQRLSCSSRLLS